MLRNRIVPCLLMKNGELTKTIQFQDEKYIGDPLNAVRIFNEKQVDELLIIDISATAQEILPNFELLEKIAAECRMPLCYGGGVKSYADAKRLVELGVEKVAISSAAIEDPDIISLMANSLGSQSVAVVIDVKKNSGLFGSSYSVFTHNGRVKIRSPLIELLQRAAAAGAGEIVINSIDRDGTMGGYDLQLVKIVESSVSVPLMFIGGAGKLSDMSDLFGIAPMAAAAAGSLFVFKGKYRAVLINYPDLQQRKALASLQT